jgi:glycosyltransferase involved in cell wall biosynthesis
MQNSLLIDISRLIGRAAKGRLPTGVDRVCLAYVARYGERSQAVLQWGGWRRIAPYRESQELFSLVMEPGARFVRELAMVIAKACMPPWPSQDAQGRLYFNLGHSGLNQSGLQPWLQRTRQRPVYLVHDLIPLTHPEYCRAGEGQRHRSRMEMLLRGGAGVVTNSHTTLQELQEFAQQLSLVCPPAIAAPLGPAALQFDPNLPAPLPKPYFVMLGTIEPRKNHLLLLHLWRQLVAEMGEHAPHLVIIGQRGWECENVVDLLERCGALHGFVHELSGCSDTDLAQYLGHAQALLFPSFAEGYGMPLVEALAVGTPAIASALRAFREAAGDVPEYLDPLDGPAWARAVRDYAAPGSPRRQAQLQRLAAFQPPTWEGHFQRVEMLLETLQ